MKHSEIRARLSEYLERDSNREERSQIERHLADCAPCASELRELRATILLLQGLPQPGHPPGLADAVMARIARGESRPARVRSLLRRVADPRFAAALAAGFAGFFLLSQEGDRGAPSTLSETVPSEIAARSPAPFGRAEGERTATAAPRLARPPGSFTIVLGDSRPPPARSVRPARAGIVSGATPSGAYAEYARRARNEEVARLLRGASHPYSESLASHFEPRSNVAMADWHPR